MVGCDGEFCEKEWFHLPCTGLKELPKGEWYCDDCKAKMVVK
jgi:inhibitor of growth protein 3